MDRHGKMEKKNTIEINNYLLFIYSRVLPKIRVHRRCSGYFILSSEHFDNILLFVNCLVQNYKRMTLFVNLSNHDMILPATLSVCFVISSKSLKNWIQFELTLFLSDVSRERSAPFCIHTGIGSHNGSLILKAIKHNSSCIALCYGNTKVQVYYSRQ